MTIHVLTIENDIITLTSSNVDVFSINNGIISTISPTISVYTPYIWEGISYDLALDDCIISTNSTDIELFFVDRCVSSVSSFNEDTIYIWYDFTENPAFELPDGDRYCIYSISDYATINLIYKNVLVVDNITINHACDDNLSVNYTFEVDDILSFMTSDEVDVFSVKSSDISLNDNCIVNAHFKTFPIDNFSVGVTSSTDIRFFDFQEILWVYVPITIVQSPVLKLNTYTQLEISNIVISSESSVPSVFSVHNSRCSIHDTASITTHVGDLEIFNGVSTPRVYNFSLNSVDIICNESIYSVDSTNIDLAYTYSSYIGISTDIIFLNEHKVLEIEDVVINLESTDSNVKKAHPLEVFSYENTVDSTTFSVSLKLTVSNCISRTITANINGMSYLHNGILTTPLIGLDSIIGIVSSNVDAPTIKLFIHPKRVVSKCVSQKISNIEMHTVLKLNTSYIHTLYSENLFMYNEMPLNIPNYN